MKVDIHGPNLRDQSKGSFHVHKHGCPDSNNRRKYHIDPRMGDPYTIEVGSEVEVVHAMYEPENFEYSGDPDADDFGIYHQDFHFFPCVSELPFKGGDA